MNVISSAKPLYPIPDASRSAVEGIREQLERLDRNVTEVARSESGDTFSPGSRERALVEQNEIVNAVRANARSLEAANETLGTLLDVKV